MGFEGRKKAIDTLGHSLQMANKVVEMYKAGDEKYSHLTDAEIEKVSKQIEEKLQWLNNSVATLEKTPKTANPTILCCQFYSEKDGFEAVCRPVVNKAKPKVEPPKEEPKKEAAAEDKKSSKAEGNNGEGAPMEESAVNGNNEHGFGLILSVVVHQFQHHKKQNMTYFLKHSYHYDQQQLFSYFIFCQTTQQQPWSLISRHFSSSRILRPLSPPLHNCFCV